jgi:glycosyltransferase involved in cell wall biosynthesis
LNRTTTFVVPVYRNRDTLAPLCDRIRATAIAAWPRETVEIILVDDASPDDAWAEIERLSAAMPGVRGVRLGENRGQHLAVLAGFALGRGDWLVSLDGDLQDPPEAAPALRAALGDADVVFAGRRGWYQAFGAMITSGVYRRLILARLGVPRDAGMFFLITAAARDRLLDSLVPDPSVIGLIAATLRTRSIPVERAAREVGTSSYTQRARLRAALRALKTWRAARGRRSAAADGRSMLSALVAQDTSRCAEPA